MTTMLAVGLRAALPADVEFEQVLYTATRDDLRPLGPQVFDDLVAMQFRAQTASITLDHPLADTKIVMVDDARAGRLIVDGSGDHIAVVDIALLPEFRGHGIGTNVLGGVVAAADRAGRVVRLHVDKHSRAVRLYERLGFVICGDLGMYLAMSRG